MDLRGKNAGVVTPTKESHASRSKIQETPKFSENMSPNVTSPGLKHSNNPAVKSAKKQKSVPRIANAVASPRNKIRERKFVVAKKKSNKGIAVGSTVTCKCKERNGGNIQKCLCVAYENLRASQEIFFNNRGSTDDQGDWDRLTDYGRAENGREEEMNNLMMQNHEIGDQCESNVKEGDFPTAKELDNHDTCEGVTACEPGTATVKRRRDKLMEEARNSVPEPGSGRVLHLVKAFERLLSMPKESDPKDEKESEEVKKGIKWALPGLQSDVSETQESLSSFCPSDLFLTSENLGLDSRCSWGSSQGSISSRTSCGGRRSRRDSCESSGTNGGWKWKKRQLKATRQKPFKLRTEQRGRCKEEEFIKKVQELMVEEEKRRIPIAQGLPWTTDEPECLMRPPVKERTRPLDLKLHSDVRAVERAEFDLQVAEKLSLIEQYKMERDRQQKLEEEEEVRRLRKELIPKAQPMPYFDRPFIPRRSEKNPTIPKEPKFHLPHQKKIKCCMSWNDINIYDHHQH